MVWSKTSSAWVVFGIICFCFCGYLISYGYLFPMSGSAFLPIFGSFFINDLNGTTNFNNATKQRNSSSITTSTQLTTSASTTSNQITTSALTTTPKETYYITTTYLANGRLGNQMYRYASLLGIAHSQGRKLVIAPEKSALEETFMLNHIEKIAGSEKWPVSSEPNAYTFEPKLLSLPFKSYRISGFLCSYYYFNMSVQEVLKEFTFKKSVLEKSTKIINDLNLNSTNVTLIGVHARRGDFVTEYFHKLGYHSPNKTYYFKAFDWMKKKHPEKNIVFVVVSDDLKWCKENLKASDVVILPDASPSVHMAIMASCSHVIISSGTYGWWGAFLAGGDVIYFNGFMPKGTEFGDIFHADTYYPPWWIPMDL